MRDSLWHDAGVIEQRAIFKSLGGDNEGPNFSTLLHASMVHDFYMEACASGLEPGGIACCACNCGCSN